MQTQDGVVHTKTGQRAHAMFNRVNGHVAATQCCAPRLGQHMRDQCGNGHGWIEVNALKNNSGARRRGSDFQHGLFAKHQSFSANRGHARKCALWINSGSAKLPRGKNFGGDRFHGP